MHGTYFSRTHESQSPIISTYSLNLLTQIKRIAIQILHNPIMIIALLDNSNAPLRCPSQQYLRRRLIVLLGNGNDLGVSLMRGGTDLSMPSLTNEESLRDE